MPRLHLFNWAMKSKARQDVLIDAAGTQILKVPAWGFDPVMAIGVRFAIAEGLMRENNTGYELVESGVLFVREILEDDSLFSTERAFLLSTGKRITEAMVTAVAKGWEVG